MYLFFENAWHVFAGTNIFFVGVSIAILQRRIFRVPQNLSVALYLWHSIFCIFYFWYSRSNVADSTTYYADSLNFDEEFKLGKTGIDYVVSLFTQGLQLSYGNVFLIFNIFGFVGLIAFASALQKVTQTSRPDIRRFSTIYLFLPGLSFWSTAIGKDALTFMAAGLVTWAVLDLRNRTLAVIVSVLFFLVPRPHMAGILLMSICFALLVSSQLGVYKKAALLLISLPLTIIGVKFGMNYAGIDNPTDLNEINRYFETRQGVNLGGGSSVDIASMPLPLRLITYLFRPFFFDANGAFGLIVSFENLILAVLFVAVLLRKTRARSTLGRFEFVFYSIFVSLSWFVLANSTANLGIAVRQKTMFLPMLVVLLLSIWQGRKRQNTG